jgi:Flp pilus assembly protein TadD
VGRFREAIERLTEAARLQPMNPFPRYQLAAAWFKLGEPEKVRAEYRKLKTFDPKVAAHVREDFGVPRDGDEVF